MGHRPSLDALRGIAVIMVLFGHADLGAPWAPASAVGVGLFFSLSGFLITALLLGELDDQGRIDIRAFYIRRARRLLPAVAVLVPAVILVGLATPRAAVPVALYFANWAWINGFPLGALAHTWSLSVEEQFYLAWPLALVLVRRPALLVTVGIALSAIALLRVSDDSLRAFAGSDTRAMNLLAGAAVAVAARRLGRVPSSTPLAVVGLAGMVALSLAPIGSYVVPLTTLAVVPVLAWVAARPERFAPTVLTGAGRISYGLYLWHYPFAYAVWPLALPWLLAFAVTAGGGLACALASWFVVERRFTATRRTPLQVVASPTWTEPSTVV